MKLCVSILRHHASYLTDDIAQDCDTPATVSGYSNSALPDPFTFNDGSPVTTAEDWECRRSQILALIQGYESGAAPPEPESVTGTASGNSLSVQVSYGGKSITFSNSITYPSGTAPAEGWPVIIAYEFPSLPIPSGVATLSFQNSAMGKQDSTSSRGQGLFYDLYGSSSNASAMTAWAWGVSRIIDAIESTPDAKLNPAAVGVTGCSRNGKGALMAGALEPRVALTLPQESGSGGDACWRLSRYEEQQGSQVQTATEIVGENCWFSAGFDQYVNNLDSLPYDHHLLAALVAPRGLISYANTDYVWLSGMSSFGCMTAAHAVYEALGVPENHGFEQVGGHSHCQWPSQLDGSLNAFINKFLLGQDVSTDYFESNNQFNGVTWSESQWINWETPTLT
ncbi:carbohydrate esterase family 15 protein [Schizophyllum commune]